MNTIIYKLLRISSYIDNKNRIGSRYMDNKVILGIYTIIYYAHCVNINQFSRKNITISYHKFYNKANNINYYDGYSLSREFKYNGYHININGYMIAFIIEELLCVYGKNKIIIYELFDIYCDVIMRLNNVKYSYWL